MNIEREKTEFELLSDQTRGILLGLVLGDGSIKINTGYKNARVSFRHSIKQEEYFEWKRSKLRGELSTKSDSWYQESTNVEEFGKKKLRYQSGAKPSLTYLYNLTHKGSIGGEIVIRRVWLNLMTPLSLAVWWCDDGSLVSNGRQGVFCTDGFQEEGVRVLDRYMKKVWGVTTEARPQGITRKEGGERYRLWIKTHEDLKKFLILIMPYIPTKTMIRKVLLLYEDAELQQRWISEIVARTKFSREEVEAECVARKEELKKFREKGRKNSEEENQRMI